MITLEQLCSSLGLYEGIGPRARIPTIENDMCRIRKEDVVYLLEHPEQVPLLLAVGKGCINLEPFSRHTAKWQYSGSETLYRQMLVPILQLILEAHTHE